MGRRALRKVDPSLDLSKQLKTFDQLPRPLDAELLFGRQSPLEIEVGSGKGLFLRTAGGLQPEVNFLGIEIIAKYAQYSAAMLVKRNLSNAIMIQGDALRIFTELIPDNSVQAVHVYFPDPWWKKRHKKRRVMRESFIRDIRRTLLPGGMLHFWTDVKEYFLSTLELIAACTDLEGPLRVSEKPAEHEMDYRTHFERRMRQNNEPVYRAEYRKKC
jgi:tRNA (guanine-N7-)-methyltransferase